jgi:Uma2 family endonuclease
MRFLHDEINIELKGKLSDDMTDREFYNFCIQNDNQRIERDENGQIFIMAPVNASGSNQNFKLNGVLFNWSEKNDSGIFFDSSAGFTLPDNSVRSPDAAWIAKRRWKSLTKKSQNEFPRICPDFIIELKSKSDSSIYLKTKMLKWIENGCKLAWLIIPEKKESHIYRANGSTEIIKGFDKKLSGENILPGFELDLSMLK